MIIITTILIIIITTIILIIGFPGQIRKFDNQIHFNFIQIRQILSYRGKLPFKIILFSFDLTFISKESVFMSFNLKSALRAFVFQKVRYSEHTNFV